MISQTGFTILVSAIWLSALAFGSLVTYWFVRQGFSDEGVVSGEDIEFEDPEYTRQSLLIWAGFFVILGLVIIIGG